VNAGDAQRTEPGRQIFVTLPYPEVQRNAGFLVENALGAEIAAHDTGWLLNIFRVSAARRIGDDLRAKGVRIRASGPIFDLNPGSLDAVIRHHTERCFLRAVDLAAALGADSLVLPTGFNPLLPSESVDGWRELSVETWESVGDAARRKGVELRIKNVFDDTPAILLGLLDTLEGFPVGACLDVGHVQVYSTLPADEWIRVLGPRHREVHLHDNLGASDDHMALGEGVIDLPPIFRRLLREDPIPALTLDMQPDDAVKSLSYIARNDLLGLQLNLL